MDAPNPDSGEEYFLSIGLVSVLMLSALWATALLISHLINGGKETDSADTLLGSGPDRLGV